MQPEKGKLLVSEPFLFDNNFHRTVILLVDKMDDSHTGFILNKITGATLNEVLEIEQSEKFPLYMGGPVSQDLLNFLHNIPELIPGGIKVCRGVYQGGDFEMVKQLINSNRISVNEIKFFLGYSGWSPFQLEGEIEAESWFVTKADKYLVFESNTGIIWEKSLKQMGGKYKILINSPENPQLN